MKEKKEKTKTISTTIGIWLLVGISVFVLGSILISQLLYDNGAIPSNTFYENTSINGVDVAGMERDEAANMISAQMVTAKEDVKLVLKHGDKTWNFSGSDFETNSAIFPIIEQTFEKGRTGSWVDKISSVRDIRTKGLKMNVSYRYVLGGFDEKIDKIIQEINVAPVNSAVVFNPDSEKEMFSVRKGVKGIEVDKEKLYGKIDNAFKKDREIVVEIPIKDVDYEDNTKEILENTDLRSTFSTSYASSKGGRKNNVQVSLNAFNGMVVQPGEEVSFNKTTGAKTPENGYQKAIIILNGLYVEDYGGGACQGSSTLYNALILADLEVLEANPHSLPVSYVPLAFDAMVSEGYSDLRFKNTLEYPVYIKTWHDDERGYVSIYGTPIEDGMEIKRRAEFVEVLPHKGDTIVKDVNGEYSDKITYIGEYLRIKKPQEGYHAKAYLDYYKEGNLCEEKLLRDEYYWPQSGVVMEGTARLGEGMVLPENEVQIIPPQDETSISESTAKKKIALENPANMNP